MFRGEGARPNLQRLVRSFGGYDKIPPDVWKNYDEAVKQWHAACLAGILDEQYANKNRSGQLSPRPSGKRRAK